jgi:type IV pilus assembly protein PilM
MARKIAWGIDIGQTALRMVKAVPAGDRIEVLGFDSIEYEQILSAPGVDRDNAIQSALRTLLSRNRITSSDVVLACIPGQSSLIRFIKLPPVERKRVPDIVRYEAHQQIPFPLEEVVWDYKPVEKAYGPGDQLEVGIFAMRRDIVQGFLSNLLVRGLQVDVVQLAPMALYNFIAFDRPGGVEAQVVIDMGAENTEILIYTGTSVWPRSLPISGNDFTEILAEKFQIPFDKAEALKRMAKQSKHSKQIYQAIEPVLRRLVEEVQRSVGYYKSINPGTRITGVSALGDSFKLPGLAKYISESLHMPVTSLTEPQNFDLGVARNPGVFRESALSFGVALGLAVQGCGMAAMDISLLPQELLQRKIIARKKPWAAAVAACAWLMFATALYTTWLHGRELKETNSTKARETVTEAEDFKRDYKQLMNVTDIRDQLDHSERTWAGRDFWLTALRKVFAPVPDEYDNEKGVWLNKMVSASMEYDTVARAIAQGETRKPESGLDFKAKGMEFQQGFIDRLRSVVRRPTFHAITPAAGAPAGSRTQRAAEDEAMLSRPDVPYVVLQGETIHPDSALYVNNSLVQKLTNTWQGKQSGIVVQSLERPTSFINPDNGAVVTDEFELLDRPLLVDVRMTGSSEEERFVDRMERVIGISDLGDDIQRTWQSILAREEELRQKKFPTWEAGDQEGEKPLPRRAQFLAKLEQDKGVRLETFTDFQVALFLDPSGTLCDDVARLRKTAGTAGGSVFPPR